MTEKGREQGRLPPRQGRWDSEKEEWGFATGRGARRYHEKTSEAEKAITYKYHWDFDEPVARLAQMIKIEKYFSVVVP